MKPTKKAKKSLGEYYSALQLRTDRWTALKIATEQLTHELSERKRGEAERTVVELLESLRPIEVYWAFPGHHTFDRLGELIVEGRFEALASTVRNICRALLSNSYRRNPHHYDVDELIEGSPDDESSEKLAKELPYFEVLLSTTFRRCRKTTCAARLPRCVARRTLPVRAGIRSQPHRCSDRGDVQPQRAGGGGAQRPQARIGADPRHPAPLPIATRRGCARGRGAQGIRPRTVPADRQAAARAGCPPVHRPVGGGDCGADLGNCRRVFYNQEDHLDLHLNILRGVSDRFEAPFFNALTQYARKPTGVFHAMPISRGKSITRSHWIRTWASSTA